MKRLTINEQKLINRFDLLDQELKSIQKLLESKGLFEKTSAAKRANIKLEWHDQIFS